MRHPKIRMMISPKHKSIRQRSISAESSVSFCFIAKTTALLCLVFLIIACQSANKFSTKNNNKINDEKSLQNRIEKSEQEIDYSHLNSTQTDLVKNSLKYIGIPYCYGGDQNGSCFDCSSYVKQVFSSIGIVLPRTSGEQYQVGKEINYKDAVPGDLVFFEDKKRINHVGIYLGNNQMIHASTSKGVILQNINEYYFQTHLAGFRRIF